MLKVIYSLVLFVGFVFGSNSILVRAKPNYKLDFTKDTKGLVRHLKVYKNPKWVSMVVLRNGKKVFFSSPKSMFEFYFRPAKWYDLGVRNENDFKHIIVTDFHTVQPTNARTAFFVYGSSQTSPAGDDLVAFKDKNKAQQFAKKYNGKRVLRFSQINDALIRLLNGRI